MTPWTIARPNAWIICHKFSMDYVAVINEQATKFDLNELWKSVADSDSMH
jgi:hypothetical protein